MLALPAPARALMMVGFLLAFSAPADAQAQKPAAAPAPAASDKAAPKAGAAPAAPKAAPGQASPQAGAAPEAPQFPWLVNCASVGGAMSCEAGQTFTIQQTGQLLLKITVRIPEKSQKGAMMLQLPHGMFLPDGVSMAIDEKPAKKEPVQMCDQQGCYVGLPLNDALLAELQSGKTFAITFKNLQKSDIKIPVPLSGFKEAYAKLQ